MARTVDQINQYIVSNVVTNFAIIGITIDPTLWSKRNIIRLLCYTFAIAQNLLEQLMDSFMGDVEAQVALAAAASGAWVQQTMFNFQYSTTNPQFVQMINGVPVYPVIDPTLRIIKACSVTTDVSNAVNVKCAQMVNGILAAMDSMMVASAQGYLDTEGTAGINYNIISLNPDQLYVSADIYFQGQYASIILASIIAAITTWLQTQSVTNFNGVIKMSDLENIIRSVSGVNDVQLKGVRGRADTDLFSAGIDLILNSQILQRQYTTNAGYIIPETTAGQTLSTTLNLIAQ